MARQQEVQRQAFGLDAPDLPGRHVIEGELEVPVDDVLGRQTAVRLVVDDLVPASGDAVHPVDHAAELDAVDLDGESEFQGGRDPERIGVDPVIVGQDLAGVVVVEALLGGIPVAVARPLAVQHLEHLVERGGHRYGTVVEPVKRPVKDVPEGERRRPRGRKPVLVLELVLGRTGLVGVDRGV